MKIDSINRAELQKCAEHSNRSVEKKVKEAPVTESPEASPARAKGVLRLLEEGHFKGVADYRLRINFFDELSELGLINAPAEETGAVEDPGTVEVAEDPEEAAAPELTETPETAEVTPEIEPVKIFGSGQAYEKFKALYEELVASLNEGQSEELPAVEEAV